MNITQENAIKSMARQCAKAAIKLKKERGRIRKADVLEIVAPYREPIRLLGLQHFEFMYYVGQERQSILGR